MTANLASGPLNLVNELVFVRLYMKSDNAITLKYARGTMNGETYRPSDDLESLMYEYRIWLYDNNPRELVLKEIPGLYPIPSLTAKLAEFLGIVYRYTRFGEINRESWMKLMAKCAGGLSLVDSDLALTVEEARMVSKYDVWSGSLEVDESVETLRGEHWTDGLGAGASVRVTEREMMEPEQPKPDTVETWTVLGAQVVERRAVVEALRLMTGQSEVSCRRVLEASGWEISGAIERFKWE